MIVKRHYIYVVISLLIFYRPDFVDYDLNSESTAFFSIFYDSRFVYLLYIPIILYILKHILTLKNIDLASTILLVNPFTIFNISEAYNKFYLIVFFSIIISNTFYRNLFVLIFHPATSLVGFLIDFKSKINFKIMIYFSFSILIMLFFADYYYEFIGKDYSLYSEIPGSEFYLNRDGNLSLPIASNFKEQLLSNIFYIIFPIFLKFNVSTIGAQILIFCFFYSFKSINKSVLLVFIMLIYSVFNPNLGSILRNILPIILGYAITKKG